MEVPKQVGRSFYDLDGEASISMPQIQKPLKNIKINSNPLKYFLKLCMAQNTISEGSVNEKRNQQTTYGPRVSKEKHTKGLKTQKNHHGLLPKDARLRRCNGRFPQTSQTQQGDRALSLGREKCSAHVRVATEIQNATISVIRHFCL